MNNLKININFVAKIDDKEWPHFLFSVNINGEAFKYKTGIGHFTPHYNDRYNYVNNRNKKPENGLSIPALNGWIHFPKIEDILYCLLSDYDAGSMSFYDFCDNFGYERDSIKALDTHMQCMKNAEKLRKALGKDFTSIKEKIEALNA